jgi:hypothetical protein
MSKTPQWPWIVNLATETIRSYRGKKSWSQVAITGGGTSPYTGKTYRATAQALDAYNAPIGGAKVTITYNTPDGSPPRNVGTHTVTATFAGDDTYDPSNATAQIVITKAALTVKANDKTKVFGAPLPALTGKLTGTLGGDRLQVTYKTDANQDSPPGTYPITLDAIAPQDLADNYTVTTQPGTLTISKAKPTITINGPETFPYDGQDHTVTATATGQGTVPPSKQPTITYTLSRGKQNVAAMRAAGTYQVLAAVEGDDNYEANSTRANITISRANLKVIPADQTMVYGGSLPVLGGSIEGAVGGDNLTATYKTVDKVSSTAAGSYPITVDTVGPDEVAANYDVQKIAGKLTIDPAKPTITLAGGGTFPYDRQPHRATATITGVNNDQLKAPTITYTREGKPVAEPRDAGTYDVTATSDLTKNYLSANATAQIVITKGKLIVKANDKAMVEGDPLPALDGSITGAVGGDNLVATYKTVDNPSAKPGGTYEITVDTVGPPEAAANYDVETSSGTLTITSRAEFLEKQAETRVTAVTKPAQSIIKWANATEYTDLRLTNFKELWVAIEELKKWTLIEAQLPDLQNGILEIQACEAEVKAIEDLKLKVTHAIGLFEIEWQKIDLVCTTLSTVVNKIVSVCPDIPRFRGLVDSGKNEDLFTLQYLAKQALTLPDAKFTCETLLKKWQDATRDTGPTVALVSTMKLMKVNPAIASKVVGTAQVADLALTGPGYSGFRYHDLTKDLKGWSSIRLGDEVSGHAPVAICRFDGEVLEVAMTAEHDSENNYVKRKPATIQSSFNDFLVYRPPSGPTSL